MFFLLFSSLIYILCGNFASRMSFWVYLIIIVLVLLFLNGESSSSPLGDDEGTRGCLPGGCFVRLGLLFIVLFMIVMIIQFLKSMG